MEKCGSENLSPVTSPLICLRVNPAVSWPAQNMCVGDIQYGGRIARISKFPELSLLDLSEIYFQVYIKVSCGNSKIGK